MNIDYSQAGVRPVRPQRLQDWETRKHVIEDLYHNTDLNDLMEVMKNTHGFLATENQYKKQFKKWKLNKNVTTSEMQAISRIRKHRVDKEGKATEFRYRGRAVPDEKIDRFAKRQKLSTDDVSSPQMGSVASTPSGISYWTPKAQDSSTSPATGFTSPGPQQTEELVSVPSPGALDFDSMVISSSFENILDRQYDLATMNHQTEFPILSRFMGFQDSAPSADHSIQQPGGISDLATADDWLVGHRLGEHPQEWSYGTPPLVAAQFSNKTPTALNVSVKDCDEDTESLASDLTEVPAGVTTSQRSRIDDQHHLTFPDQIVIGQSQDEATSIPGGSNFQLATRGVRDDISILDIDSDEFYASDSDGSTDSIGIISSSKFDVVTRLRREDRHTVVQPADPDRALRDAARRNDADLVRSLLESGANAETTAPSGMNTLHIAAYRGHADVVRCLLDFDIDIRAPVRRSINAPIISTAIFEPGTKKIVTLYGITAIHLAALKKHPDVVDMLRAFGANENVLQWAVDRCLKNIGKFLITRLDWLGQYRQVEFIPLLRLAAEHSNSSMMKVLLDDRSRRQSLCTVVDLKNALLIAVRSQSVACAELLLRHDVDLADDEHNRALHNAAEQGHLEMVDTLLQHGFDASIETKDGQGRTPLMWAAANGHEAVVRLLLDRGADVNATDCDGLTPLLWTARNGQEAVMRLLLDKGADIGDYDRWGQTLLLWAAKNGHEAVVRLLLDRGADVEMKEYGYDGQTPLLWAAENGHEAVVRLLLDKGANFGGSDRWGWTPLLWAAKNGHEAVVRMLLDRGADVEMKKYSYDGQTPLLCAAKNGHEAVVRLLKSHLTQLSS